MCDMLKHLQTNSAGNGTAAPTAGGAIEKRLSRLESILAERHGSLPVWIRSPKGGTEHFTGLSRSKLYDLSTQGAIRSVSIREPGAIKGTRLFNLQSVLEFIDSQAQQSAA